MIRTTVAGLCLALLLSGLAAAQPAAAPGVTDPRAFVLATYQRIIREDGAAPSEAIYTTRMMALLSEERRDLTAKGIGPITNMTFSHWVNGQDAELTDLQVRSEPVAGHPDRMVVHAVFKNFGDQQEVDFVFEREGGRWRLDDIWSGGWPLSMQLKYSEAD